MTFDDVPQVGVEQPQAAPQTHAGARWAAGTLLVIAVVVGVLGHLLLPRMLVWLLIGILIWAAVTIFWRTIDHQFRTLPPGESIMKRQRELAPLEPGESYDTAVKLTYAPNVPLAETLCSRLQANGIEAFYKRMPGPAASWGATNDFGPVEIWVGGHDLERARALLSPE